MSVWSGETTEVLKTDLIALLWHSQWERGGQFSHTLNIRPEPYEMQAFSSDLALLASFKEPFEKPFEQIAAEAVSFSCGQMAAWEFFAAHF